mgnify:CR=1
MHVFFSKSGVINNAPCREEKKNRGFIIHRRIDTPERPNIAELVMKKVGPTEAALQVKGYVQKESVYRKVVRLDREVGSVGNSHLVTQNSLFY